MTANPPWLNWPASTEDAPPTPTPPQPAAKRQPAVWRPMTDMELRAAVALSLCRLPPATSTKRIALSMAAEARAQQPRITDKQAVYLWRFAYTFRRQICDSAVVREAVKRHDNQGSPA